jgi:hypothetical protein
LTKNEKVNKVLPSVESEQVTDEEMKELIEQVKLINKVMEYCSKNPKECE